MDTQRFPKDGCSYQSAVSTGQEPDFRIFTSYRFDPHRRLKNPGSSSKGSPDDHHYLLVYQRDRLQAAAEALQWTDVARMLTGAKGLLWLMKAVHDSLWSARDQEIVGTETCKIRVSISQSGSIEVDASVIDKIALDGPQERDLMPNDLSSEPCLVRLCKVYLDYQSTSPSIFSRHKTNARSQYDAARRRIGISDLGPSRAEVLMFNPSDEVMEASLSTPYFFRNGRWVTPPLSSGGNAGTTRRFALLTGLCVEEIVTRDSLLDREVVWISNAVRGFLRGLIHLSGSCSKS